MSTRHLESMTTYYTVVVPWVGSGATQWHPTDKTGPFCILTRGAFETEAEAIDWGREHLNGCPYSVKRIGPTQRDEVGLNGAMVTRSGDDSTIFIALPRHLWRSCGDCRCAKCVDPDTGEAREGFWDTLAVAAEPPEHRKGSKKADYTWTVHKPR